MTLGTIDRRTRMLLGVVGVMAVLVVLRYTVWNGSQPVVVESESIPAAEKRLDILRQKAALVPGKEAVLKQAREDLAQREQGVLKADTKEQAEAQLLGMVQDIARANGIDARGNQGFREKPLSADYAEVAVTVPLACQIEQLVNLLASLANQPEILATEEIHASGGADKKKILQVQLTVGAVIPRKLLPEKKGPSF